MAQSRRASLQAESPARSLGSVRLISSGLGASRRSSPTTLSGAGKSFKKNVADMLEYNNAKRRLSYAPGASIGPIFAGRSFNTRDVIFDIGADYMKVRSVCDGVLNLVFKIFFAFHRSFVF